eukprot:scaffold139711_cov72-Phaeocystis_antarctica.AAC.1
MDDEITDETADEIVLEIVESPPRAVVSGATEVIGAAEKVDAAEVEGAAEVVEKGGLTRSSSSSRLAGGRLGGGRSKVDPGGGTSPPLRR